MQVVVIADGITQKEFQDKQIAAGAIVEFVATIDEISGGADGFFYLLEEDAFVEDAEKIEKSPHTWINAWNTTSHIAIFDEQWKSKFQQSLVE